MAFYVLISLLLLHAKLPKLCDALSHKKTQLLKSKQNVDLKKIFKIKIMRFLCLLV